MRLDHSQEPVLREVRVKKTAVEGDTAAPIVDSTMTLK